MRLIRTLLSRHSANDAAPDPVRGKRNRLKRETERRLELAGQALEADDLALATQHLEWVQKAEHIIAATARPPRKIYLAAFVAFVCVLLAGLTLWLRTGNVAVQVELEVNDLAMRLATDRSWSAEDLDIHVQRLRLTNLQNLDAPGLGLAGPASAVSLSVSGEHDEALLELRQLSAAANAELFLYVTDYPRIDIKDGVLEGSIDANRINLESKSGAQTTELYVDGLIPETLKFATRSATGSPAQLALQSTSPWQFAGMRAQRMVFEREVPPHSSNWESTVLGGSVRLLETNDTISLHKSDRLRLGAVVSERLSIAFDPSKPDRFRIQLHGTVEKVETGPTGFVRNRAPTWLDYFYHQQHLALFWGAVVFLWGMFWSVRNLL